MKTIKILVALALLCAGQTFAANTEDRPVSGFHAVESSGSFDVYITQGNTESVKVEAPDDILKEVITEVHDGTLSIHGKNHFNWSNNIFNHKKVSVYVTAKNIDGISLSGSGSITFKDGLTTGGNANLHVSGSGSIEGKLTAKSLDASVSGSGSVKLAGSAEKQDVSVSGSGGYSAHDFSSVKAHVAVSGSGSATVYASESIDAHVSGSGGVHYGGNPKNVYKSKSGSGSISSW